MRIVTAAHLASFSLLPRRPQVYRLIPKISTDLETSTMDNAKGVVRNFCWISIACLRGLSGVAVTNDM